MAASPGQALAQSCVNHRLPSDNLQVWTKLWVTHFICRDKVRVFLKLLHLNHLFSSQFFSQCCLTFFFFLHFKNCDKTCTTFTILTIFKCTGQPVALSTFTLPCSRHHCPAPELFHLPEQRSHTPYRLTCLPAPASPWHPPFYFLS